MLGDLRKASHRFAVPSSPTNVGFWQGLNETRISRIGTNSGSFVAALKGPQYAEDEDEDGGRADRAERFRVKGGKAPCE